MSEPLVSVVLPVFNGSATIERAIRSIQRQQFPAWELIAVDDGSTDGTSAHLQQFAREDVRIRVFTIEHGGIVAALGRALAKTRAPFVARMDADDESDPERLQEQFAYLQDNPTVGLVSSLVRFGGDPQQASGFALHVSWMNSLVTAEQIALNRFVESPLAHPSVLFRRELLDQFGGYREGDFPEDYELWLRWLDAGVRMAKVNRVLFTWNDSEGRLSRQSERYGSDQFYRCKAGYLARWLKREISPGRSVLVWGAGRPTRKRAAYLEAHDIRIAAYVDIDPAKIGRKLNGRAVLSPSDIPIGSFVVGYVAKRGARDLARAYLQSRGFLEGKDFIMAA